MRKLLKKVFLTALALVILLSPLSPLALQIEAAPPSPWYNQTFPEWYNKVYNSGDNTEIFGERYAAAQVQWVIYGLMSAILNQATSADIVSCLMNLGSDPKLAPCVQSLKSTIENLAKQEKTSYPVNQDEAKERLSLGHTLKDFATVMISNKPMSGITYVKEVARKFRILPEVQAQQSFGFFTALDPIRNVWQATRNISYGLLIIVLIAMAFMIMFRVKTSPQTIITVQSAIPNVVVAIILITFSYAIAGFLIDLMYVVLWIVSLAASNTIFANFLLPAITYFEFITKGFPGPINIQFGFIFIPWMFLALFTVAFFAALFSVGGILGLALTTGVLALFLSTGLGLIITFILIVVVILATIWIGIRVMFMLLRTYANILLLTIAAPFQIILGLLAPQIGFSHWIRNYIINLGVFVTTCVLVLLSVYFCILSLALSVTDVFGSLDLLRIIVSVLFGAGAGNFLVAGAVGGIVGSNAYWPPLLGVTSTPFLMLGVAFVIFSIIPNAAQFVQALVAGQVFNYGAAVGQATGIVQAPFRFTWEAIRGGAQRAAQDVVQRRLGGGGP